jgi:hypothetical protein
MGLRATIFVFAIATAATVWCYLTHPSPGTSVGILGAMAVVISLRATMKAPEKLGWIVIAVILIWLEVGAIHTTEQQNIAEREEINTKFEALNAKSESISSNMNTVLTNLKTTLEDVDATLAQTKPQAMVLYKDLDFDNFAIRDPFEFSITYSNEGMAEARNISMLARAYVGPENPNHADEDAIVRKFEDEWRKSAIKFGSRQLFNPREIATENFRQAGFTGEEKHRLVRGPDQIYFLFRVAYSDDLGRWRSDICMHSNQIAVTLRDISSQFAQGANSVHTVGSLTQCEFFYDRKAHFAAAGMAPHRPLVVR